MVKAIKLCDWFGQDPRGVAPVLTPSLASQLLQGWVVEAGIDLKGRVT